MDAIDLKPDPHTYVEEGLEHHRMFHESLVDAFDPFLDQLTHSEQEIVRSALSGLFHTAWVRTIDAYHALRENPTQIALDNVSDMRRQERESYENLLGHVKKLVSDRDELVAKVTLETQVEMQEQQRLEEYEETLNIWNREAWHRGRFMYGHLPSDSLLRTFIVMGVALDAGAKPKDVMDSFREQAKRKSDAE